MGPSGIQWYSIFPLTTWVINIYYMSISIVMGYFIHFKFSSKIRNWIFSVFNKNNQEIIMSLKFQWKIAFVIDKSIQEVVLSFCYMVSLNKELRFFMKTDKYYAIILEILHISDQKFIMHPKPIQDMQHIQRNNYAASSQFTQYTII